MQTLKNPMTSPSPLHQLLTLLNQSLLALGKKMPPHQMENIAVLIQDAMSTRNRSYHGVDHVFSISEGATPIETLAILFHDIVYWQIDRARHPVLQKFMAPYVPNDQGQIKILSNDEEILASDGSEVSLSRKVFGLKTHQLLTPLTGVHEFLSARVAEECLKSTLDPWEMIQVLACIEATIPFRGKDEAGRSPVERLPERLEKIGIELDLKLSKNDIEKAVMHAAEVANRDLGSFACTDVGDFLNNTWMLLSETNPALQAKVYRCKDYRIALQKMEGFLGSLKVETIFSSYDSTPTPAELEALRKKAQCNIELSLHYLQAKLLAIGLVEALAELSGGDAPIMLFMGQLSEDPNVVRFEHALATLPKPRGYETSTDPEVRLLLEAGRSQHSNFDLRKSPLAAYVYSRLAADEFSTAMNAAMNYFRGTIKAHELLGNDVLFRLVLDIIPPISDIAWTRKSQLTRISELIRHNLEYDVDWEKQLVD